mgnify:CR=1 FL=1
MSRLDSFIARMKAQRDCLNFLKPAIEALPGPILEVGLGNGRTNIMQGAVQIVIFAAFLFLSIVP